MNEVLGAVLDAHLNAGGLALLMSATLGSTAMHRLLRKGQKTLAPILDEAIGAPYPALSTLSGMSLAGQNDRSKDVAIRSEPQMQDFGVVAARVLEAMNTIPRVLVVRNTGNFAIQTQQVLEETFGSNAVNVKFAINGIPTLHHGRFAGPDRVLLDNEVERNLGRSRPPGGLVVVGTQTLEQSLAIDPDLLIADLCPSNVLLQRMGRLHRHRLHDRPASYDKPQCIVWTPLGSGPGSLAVVRNRGQRPGAARQCLSKLHSLEATRRLIGKALSAANSEDEPGAGGTSHTCQSVASYHYRVRRFWEETRHQHCRWPHS